MLRFQNLVYESMPDSGQSSLSRASPPSPPLPPQPEALPDSLPGLAEDPRFEFPREKLKLGRLIDEGAFGRVYLAEAFGILPNRYKTTVAVKTLKENPSRDEVASFARELAVMKSVGERHPNVVSLLGTCSARSGPAYAIVEYAKHGSLRTHLRTLRPSEHAFYSPRSAPFATDQLSTFVATASPQISAMSLSADLVKFGLQVASGMRFLHAKQILHRDLAARNVLVDEAGVAKVADFGLARDVGQRCYYSGGGGEAPLPVKWMAPESLFERKAYASSDVWSFGVLLWEICSLGGDPYPTVPVESLLDFLSEGKRMSKPTYCDDEL